MEIIRPQYGAIIRSNNVVKDKHVISTLSEISKDYEESETYVKYELGYNSDPNIVVLYGYGFKSDEVVKQFLRDFRKQLRLHGHVLEGNRWLYGEKAVQIEENKIEQENQETRI